MNLMDSSTKPDDLLTEAKAVAVVQQQICKWKKNDKNPHHSIKKDLKENKDFEVKSEALEGSTSSGHQFCVYIYCKLCKRIIHLDGSVILSNYSQHVPKCTEKTN